MAKRDVVVSGAIQLSGHACIRQSGPGGLCLVFKPGWLRGCQEPATDVRLLSAGLERLRVGRRVDGDRRDAQLLAGADDPQGDLAQFREPGGDPFGLPSLVLRSSFLFPPYRFLSIILPDFFSNT